MTLLRKILSVAFLLGFFLPIATCNSTTPEGEESSRKIYLFSEPDNWLTWVAAAALLTPLILVLLEKKLKALPRIMLQIAASLVSAWSVYGVMFLGQVAFGGYVVFMSCVSYLCVSLIEFSAIVRRRT